LANKFAAVRNVEERILIPDTSDLGEGTLTMYVNILALGRISGQA
jgi:hypothetical protein